MKYRRIMLKISGEGLMGKNSFGIDPEHMGEIAEEIAKAHHMGIKIAITVGGGNIFRGIAGTAAGMNRVQSDHMGMLATVINAIALRDVLMRRGIPATVMSAIPMLAICEAFIQEKALYHFDKGSVIIFAAGTGNPFFTTDSGAALRAAEMKCDALFKATQVDGVYSADPKKDPSAVRYERITYDEVMSKDLRVMDMAAIAIAKDTGVPVVVFSLHEKDSLIKTIKGEGNFTVVGEKE